MGVERCMDDGAIAEALLRGIVGAEGVADGRVEPFTAVGGTD